MGLCGDPAEGYVGLGFRGWCTTAGTRRRRGGTVFREPSDGAAQSVGA
jgi:hypothetical protein